MVKGPVIGGCQFILHSLTLLASSFKSQSDLFVSMTLVCHKLIQRFVSKVEGLDYLAIGKAMVSRLTTACYKVREYWSFVQNYPTGS